MTPKILAAIVLALGIIFIAVTLIRRSRLGSSLLNLDDLLLGDDGKVSKAAAVMLGAFALTSWVVGYLTLTKQLTEGYFTAYLAAWVAPTVTRLIVNRPTSTSPTVSETTTSSSSKTVTPNT